MSLTGTPTAIPVPADLNLVCIYVTPTAAMSYIGRSGDPAATAPAGVRTMIPCDGTVLCSGSGTALFELYGTNLVSSTLNKA